ncbi:hypothetical protein DWX17_14185 [[Clostridium] innocuum]|nr:hypothetical protein DWX17_14185 [[Clostridium] innocuum]
MLFFTRMNALSCKAFIITEFYFMNTSCFERGFHSCIKHVQCRQKRGNPAHTGNASKQPQTTIRKDLFA